MEDKIRVSIVIAGGNVQQVLSNAKDIRIDIIDLDNDPEVEIVLEEKVKGLHKIY